MAGAPQRGQAGPAEADVAGEQIRQHFDEAPVVREADVGVHPQAGGGSEHRSELLTAEPGPDGFRRGDHQAEDLLLGFGGGMDR